MLAMSTWTYLALMFGLILLGIALCTVLLALFTHQQHPYVAIIVGAAAGVAATQVIAGPRIPR